MASNSGYIVNFSELYRVDEDLVGKNLNDLGELAKLGIAFPDGFVITTKFHDDFIRQTGIKNEVEKLQKINHPAISDSNTQLLYSLQKQIIEKSIPQELASLLYKFYRKYSGLLKEQSFNLSTFSENMFFRFDNLSGDANFVLMIKTIWSLSPIELVAIFVQKNIDSKIAGKTSTNDCLFNNKLNNEQKNRLSHYCGAIQKYFYFPKEIEYAVAKGKIVITKISPFTGSVTKQSKQNQDIKVKTILAKGTPISSGIATGPVKFFNNENVKTGEIVFVQDLDQDIFDKIKNSKAIISDSAFENFADKSFYQRNFHAPAIIDIKKSAKIFKNGNIITVNGISGEIYSGGLIY